MNRILSLLFAGLFMLAGPSKAQTLHFIFFGDTNDPRIGNPTKVAHAYYETMVDDASKYAKLNPPVKQRYTGEDFNSKNLEQAISKLQVGPQDIILFYISAHGYNDGTSEYPRIVMESNNAGSAGNSINLSTIYERLRAKNARLTLVFGEACNAQRSDNPEAGPARTATHPPVDVNPEQYRELFRRSQLGVLACSSRREQVSVSDREEGGRFSQAFFNVLGQYTSSKSMNVATWDKLMNETRTKTRAISRSLGAGEQDPYYEIFPSAGDAQGLKLADLAPQRSAKPNSFTSAKPVAKAKEPVKTIAAVTESPKPAPKAEPAVPASRSASKAAPCYNNTAFETIRSYQRFVEIYWKGIDMADLEDAREAFSQQVYTEDKKEFYDNLVDKLQVGQYPAEAARLEKLGKGVIEILDETDEQLNSPNFKMKASSKLAMVVSDLKKIIQEMEGINRNCRER